MRIHRSWATPLAVLAGAATMPVAFYAVFRVVAAYVVWRIGSDAGYWAVLLGLIATVLSGPFVAIEVYRKLLRWSRNQGKRAKEP